MISGSNRHIGDADDEGRLAGVVPMIRAANPDIARSRAGRASGKPQWLPSVFLPRFGTGSKTSCRDLPMRPDNGPTEVNYRVNAGTTVVSSVFERWR
jgi:hypothetical protein